MIIGGLHTAERVVFSEICVNTGYDPLERPTTEDAPPVVTGPTSGQLALILQPNTAQRCNTYLQIFFLYITLIVLSVGILK